MRGDGDEEVDALSAWSDKITKKRIYLGRRLYIKPTLSSITVIFIEHLKKNYNA